MKDSVERLLKHRHAFFSKEGEDGVLAYILSRIPNRTGWCVEFGAWDGVSESNTHYFISQQGYRGVMIEADPLKYNRLYENMRQYGTICINAFVRPEGENRLDNILSHTSIPKEFDLLSIDVDGEDYHVWRSLERYQPKVVIIEINIHDKPGLDRIHKPGSPIFQRDVGTRNLSTIGIYGYSGTSITSMTKLATRKGYSLLANVHCNAIYVKSEYRDLFHDREVTPEDVFTYENYGIRGLSLGEMNHLGWKRVLAKNRLFQWLLSLGK